MDYVTEITVMITFTKHPRIYICFHLEGITDLMFLVIQEDLVNCLRDEKLEGVGVGGG